MKNLIEQFLEVFEPLPELTLETLEARNKLEFNRQRNYPLEHNLNNSKENENGRGNEI